MLIPAEKLESPCETESKPDVAAIAEFLKLINTLHVINLQQVAASLYCRRLTRLKLSQA
jgi:hypothetical protein